MSIRLTIDTDDRRLAFDLMGNPKQVGAGTATTVPGDATLTVVLAQLTAKLRSPFEWRARLRVI